MSDNRADKYTRSNPLLNWWWRLMGRSAHQPHLPGEQLGNRRTDNQSKDETVTSGFCRHNRVSKTFARKLQFITGRRSTGRVLKNICPICGLPAPGDRMVEYVLKIWFIDGDSYEYNFRGRSEEDCYRISDSVLKIYLKNSVVSYPLQIVGTVEFSAREVPPDSPVVEAAQRIIDSRSDPD
ncbi:MAG: hypothetical protein JSU65_04675 [Candidatus Zixiibacteriota bacterium]|nr:MAG: hypothetical protein JSU65_04675 [candidate division Zixibacteria bacterium]